MCTLGRWLMFSGEQKTINTSPIDLQNDQHNGGQKMWQRVRKSEREQHTLRGEDGSTELARTLEQTAECWIAHL